jgi:hypothetical protein
VRLYDSEDREEDIIVKAVPVGDHQAAERSESRRPQVHSHEDSHHHVHGDLESLMDRPDSDAETDSTAEDDELVIGRKRQIVGILV